MSPLAAPPARGFADFQRTGPWDSAPLFSRANQAIAGGDGTGIMDVSRWAYLGGYEYVTGQDVQMTITWWADAAGTVAIGGRIIMLSQNVGGSAQYRLPNLGPFVSIAWAPFAGANWTHNVELIGTNRAHPLELIPGVGVLVNLSGIALAGSATVNNYPGGYYAGPLHVHYFTGQAGQLNFQWLDVSGTWDNFDVVPIIASTHTSFVTIVPPGAWRIEAINNTAVATTFNLQAVPSLTGGS